MNIPPPPQKKKKMGGGVRIGGGQGGCEWRSFCENSFFLKGGGVGGQG